MQLEGVYSVLPTPFHPNGDIDEASLRRVVDLFIAAGVNGVTALGVTGEVARLDESERRQVLEVVVEQVNGRIGVVAGATAEGTRTCIGYSRHAHATGATAVMVSPPRMPKLNSDAVLRHFGALASAVDIESSSRTTRRRVDFQWSRRCSRASSARFRGARTIKLEDPPTPFKTSRIVESCGEIPVRIFGGLGGVFLLEELLAGATGAMTGLCLPRDSRLCGLPVSCRADHRSGRYVLSRRAADALRVPGGHRPGDSEGGPPPPGRARARGDAASGRGAGPGDARGSRPRHAVERVAARCGVIPGGRAETIGGGRHCQLTIGVRTMGVAT